MRGRSEEGDFAPLARGGSSTGTGDAAAHGASIE